MGMTSFGAGFAVGFGSGFLAREFLPVAREIIKPVTRVMSKSGIQAFEFSREAFARLGEGLDDILAEVRSEMKLKRLGHKGKHKKLKAKKAKSKVVPIRKAEVAA